MKNRSKNSLKVLAGIAIGVLFLYLFLKKADLPLVAENLAKARFEFILLSALCTMIGFFFRALRWKYFLMPVKKIGIVRLFSTMSIGYMVSTYTPRLGEIARPYILGDKENISKSAAFATIVVERIFDFLTVLFLFSLYLLFFADSGLERTYKLGSSEITMAWIQRSGILVALGTLGLTLFLVGLRFKRDRVLNITKRTLRVLPGKIASGIHGFISSFAEGLALFQSPRNILWAVFYSAVTWFFILLAVWVMPLAYNLSPLPFHSMFFLVFLIAIGVSVPTPGAMGTFHYMCQAGFWMLGLTDINMITGMVILLHAASVIPINIVGLIAFWKEGLSLYILKKAGTHGKEDNVKDLPRAAVESESSGGIGVPEN
ncbi:lysylphosphatidylglycerol synthase transmembrane domain-containing protein [Acidobacteriota bacterium]